VPYKLKHKEIPWGFPINLIALQLIKQPTYVLWTGFLRLDVVINTELRVNSFGL